IMLARSSDTCFAGHATATTLPNAAPTIPKLLMNASVTSKRFRLVVVENSRIETMAVIPPTIQTAVLRAMPALSLIDDTTTSTILNSEVNPANTIAAKNKKPNHAPPGMAEMMVGNATNASPTPDSATSATGTLLADAMNPRAEKTPIPASSSKPLLENPTTRPAPVRFVRRFKYDA